MDWQQAVTLWVAIIGALTGLSGIAIAFLAYQRERNRDKVRLRLVVMNALVGGPGTDPEHWLTIEVVNLSTFPVTVRSVGLCSQNWQMPVFRTTRGESLPHRLGSRESFEVYCTPASFREQRFAEMRWAFAKTACGVQVLSAPITEQLSLFARVSGSTDSEESGRH
jgi:hypothetical protein